MIQCRATSLWLSRCKDSESEVGLPAGSPLGGVASIDTSLEEKIEALKAMTPVLNIFQSMMLSPSSFPSSTTSCGLTP